MKAIVTLIQVAGVVQLGIAGANYFLPRLFEYSSNLPKLSPIVRQVFVVHSFYIVFVLLIFGTICVFFAPDLAGASDLGSFLAAAMFVFWLPRLGLQLFYYDPQERRRFPKLNLLFVASLIYLIFVFGVAAYTRLPL